MRNVTLADIAKKTGYSINTVSHALHDKADISEKTKAYIIKTANEIGYIGNSSAGALRSGRSKNAAIIVGDISNPHFSIMIKEMEARLREYGYSAFILNTDENEELEKNAIISAISKSVDGIILCPVQKTTDNIDFLNNKKIPYILIGRKFDNIPASYVICDDVNGGRLAAEHMFSENRKKILFLNGPSFVSGSRDRLEGIKQAYNENNISPENLITIEVDIMNNRETIKNILMNNDDCTAVICFSDLIAMQVCRFLRQLGKKIPEDVSVIGFDNIASKFYFPLMLSSVTSSKTKMSVRAVDSLIKIIDKKNNGICRHVLPTKLVLRETTQNIEK